MKHYRETLMQIMLKNIFFSNDIEREHWIKMS